MVDHKKIVLEHVALFNKAERAYKESQLATLRLREPILNEFHYCARSQASMMEMMASGSIEASESEFFKQIQTANLALACIINDCVDLVVIYVRRAIANLNRKYPAKVESAVESVDTYLHVLRSIEKIETTISTSREERLNRLKMYMDVIEGGNLTAVVNFALSLPRIEVQLRASEAIDS
jgi:hypothetical protein